MIDQDSRLREVLEQTFLPMELRIVNQSEQHRGHTFSPNSGHSHYRIFLTSSLFSGKSRLQRRRMVFKALQEKIPDHDWHALDLLLKGPGE